MAVHIVRIVILDLHSRIGSSLQRDSCNQPGRVDDPGGWYSGDRSSNVYLDYGIIAHLVSRFASARWHGHAVCVCGLE
jgi:hypothetical protein